jgi:hypothetical protein
MYYDDVRNEKEIDIAHKMCKNAVEWICGEIKETKHLTCARINEGNG